MTDQEVWQNVERAFENDNPGTAYTQFPGQPFRLRCGIYSCTDEGVKYERGERIFTACAHPVMPLERLVNIDTGEEHIRLGLCRGGIWRSLTVERETISRSQTIVSLAAKGVGVTSENARSLVRYLADMEQMNYDALPCRKLTSRMGWIAENGFSPYIGNVAYDSGGRFAAEFNAIHPEGDYEAWIALTRYVRFQESTAARVALAASFASALVEPLGAQPFMVHLWGVISGSGKTVALMLAASVWADPAMGRYVKSLHATDVALEQLAAFSGSLPLCLDELQLIQERKDGFDRLIYMLCEGVGKSRGAKAGGLRATGRWCNAIITTGEQPITGTNSRAGVYNRVLEIEAPAQVFKQPAELCETIRAHYGHAGPDFVRRLQADRSLIDEARRLAKAYQRQLEQEGVTDKQSLAAGVLLAADELAGRLIYGDGPSLIPEDLLPFLATNHSVDTNARAYEWLCDWVAGNPGRFISKRNAYMPECWGALEYDGSEEPVRACIVKAVFDRELAAAGFNPYAFLTWAARTGRIECERGHYTRKKRLDTGAPPARCVFLSIEPGRKYEDLLQGFEPVQEELPFDDPPQLTRTRVPGRPADSRYMSHTKCYIR